MLHCPGASIAVACTADSEACLSPTQNLSGGRPTLTMMNFDNHSSETRNIA
jgi:hypothetical protein